MELGPGGMDVRGRRLNRRGAALAGAVMVAALAPTAGPAIGLGDAGVNSVSVPQLQTPSQLPQTPQASVPVPQVPQVSTPQVSTPQVSTPQVSTPQVSTPSVRTPQVSTPSVRT